MSQRPNRPLVARRAVGPWAVACVAVFRGLYASATNVDVSLSPPGVAPGADAGLNYRVFHVAAETARAGGDFYAVTPPDASAAYVYLYPPITVVAYYPFTLLSQTAGYALLTLLTLVACLDSTRLVVTYLESHGRRLGWVDVGAIAAVFVASSLSFGTIYYGNVNLVLAWLFVLGFVRLADRRERLAGVAFGVAALWKLFPAIVGAWLVRRRAWRAVGAATLTGATGLLAGVLEFGPGRTRQYFLTVVPDRSATEAFVGGYPPDGVYYVTVQRPLSHLVWSVWPDAPPSTLTPLALLLCGAVLATFYRDVSTERDRLFGVLATTLVAVVVAPSLQWYLALAYFPLLALLYQWETGPGRWAFLAGAVLLFASARPSSVVEAIIGAGLPGPVETVLVGLTTVATIHLYGVALLLGACLFHRRARTTDAQVPDDATASESSRIDPP